MRPTALAMLLLTVAGCGTAVPYAPDLPDLREGTRLVITTPNGVRLRPVEGREAPVGGSVRWRWSGDDATRVLDLGCPRTGHCDPMPTVGVPAGVPVVVMARDAGVDVAGLAAALDLTTTNGDVTVVQAGTGAARVRAVTRNGSIRASGLRAADLGAATVNGDVELGLLTAPTGVNAATSNGSVRLTVAPGGPGYTVDAATTNGRRDVTLPNGPGRVTLRTVNGDVTARISGSGAV